VNDAQFGRQIATLLDEGLDRVDDEVVSRLQLARKAALGRAGEQRNRQDRQDRWEKGRQDTRAAVGAITGTGWRSWLSGWRIGIATAALVLAVSGMLLWAPDTGTEQIAGTELDVGILTDELPVSAYIEAGFDAWLKRPNETRP